MIELINLKKSFGSRTLWDNVNGNFLPGTMTALTGPSGSGKSTLLNCIGSLDRPDHGEIRVEGRDLSRFSQRAQRLYRKEKVGYLFQDFALIPDRSVAYNLQIAVSRHHWAAIDGALASVGLEGFAEKLVFELSGGEQQRTALARVLLKQPPIILADEPTGSLDPANGSMVTATLRSLADAGATVVVATHSPLVSGASDAIVELGGPGGISESQRGVRR